MRFTILVNPGLSVRMSTHLDKRHAKVLTYRATRECVGMVGRGAHSRVHTLCRYWWAVLPGVQSASVGWPRGRSLAQCRPP